MLRQLAQTTLHLSSYSSSRPQTSHASPVEEPCVGAAMVEVVSAAGMGGEYRQAAAAAPPGPGGAGHPAQLRRSSARLSTTEPPDAAEPRWPSASSPVA